MIDRVEYGFKIVLNVIIAKY